MKRVKVMNNQLTEIVDFLQENNDYSLVAHGGPDGDSLGSIVALGSALKKLGKRVRMYSSDPIPKQFEFLDFMNEIHIGIPHKTEDVLIVLDCSDEKRLRSQNIDNKKFKHVINIDHHPANTMFGNLNYCEDDKIANCELVYYLLQELPIELDTKIAEALYLGIITDSGFFGFDNTSASTHNIVAKLLALGVSPNKFKTNLEKKPLSHLKILGQIFSNIEQSKDGKVSYLLLRKKDLLSYGIEYFSELDDIIDYLRNISGTELAIFIKEEEGFKFSLRSNSSLDVGDLCRQLGGGGHSKAAGFSTTEDPIIIINKILEKISQVR